MTFSKEINQGRSFTKPPQFEGSNFAD